MTDRIDNKLTISGSENEMKKFFDILKSANKTDFCMNSFIPLPKELKEIGDSTFKLSKNVHASWIDWTISNWGCESDVLNVTVLSETENVYCIMYNTYYEPNIKFVEQLYSIFPELSFELDFDYIDMKFPRIFTIDRSGKNEFEYKAYCLHFSSSKNDSRYSFIKEKVYTENNNLDYHYVRIVKLWEKCLLLSGISKVNVVNWDDVVSHCNNLPW
jgi:hypothetical protein